MFTSTTFDSISTPIESRIATSFARIGTAMRSQAWELAVANGLTPTQVDILALLAARSSPLRLSVIAEQLAITPATASDAVSTLVAKGLAEKGRDAEDGRAIALRLSASGAKLSATVAEASGFLGLAVQSLGQEEKTQLLRMMIKVIRNLQESGKIPTSRMCVTCKYFDANRYVGSTTPHHCNLVSAPMGVYHLRLDCPEHSEAEPLVANRNWLSFAG
ncbi:MarR family winged helix-turn-helix transcriptional regulator [Paraherbaspirillum soli]|uniref:MarR family winged helix-turn-helix transcriptional regulator n=1 Tax=Paraherbaspirillum soli TaxID=631222 RepID=A0ABW0M9C6_9BURK